MGTGNLIGMSESVHQRVNVSRDSQVVDEIGTAASALDFDAVLDRIDEVLETNAEEYVRSFVQKGGE